MTYPYDGKSDPNRSRDEWRYDSPASSGSDSPTTHGWSASPPPVSGQSWPYPPALPLAQPAPSPYAALGQPPARMPRDEALSIVRRLKRWIAAGAILGFGVLAGLAATHGTGVTASASPSSPAVAPSNSSSSSQPSDGGGFFNSGNHGGGSYFGPGTSSQAPVSGSSVS